MEWKDRRVAIFDIPVLLTGPVCVASSRWFTYLPKYSSQQNVMRKKIEEEIILFQHSLHWRNRLSLDSSGLRQGSLAW